MIRITPLLFLFALSLSIASATEPAVAPPDVKLGANANSNDIGFSSVQAALAALSKKEGVEIREKQGWTTISDPSERTIWTFAPIDHPAYPAVAKRQVVLKDGNMFLDMRVLCESTTEACDKLALQYQQLYNKTMEDIRKSQSAQP